MSFETTSSEPKPIPESVPQKGERLNLQALGKVPGLLPEETRRTGIALVTIDGTKNSMHAIADTLYGGMDGLSTQQKELLLKLTGCVEARGELGGIKPADIADHGPFVIQLNFNQGHWDFAPQEQNIHNEGPLSTVQPLTVPDFDPNGVKGPLTLRSMGPLAAHVLPDEILQTGKLQFTVPEGSSLTAALAKALGTSYSKAGVERQNFILNLVSIAGTHLDVDHIPAGILFHFDLNKGTFDVMQPNPSREDPNYLVSYKTQLDLPVLAERAEALNASEEGRLVLLEEMKERETPPTLHEALQALNGYGTPTGQEARAAILRNPDYLAAINEVLTAQGALPITESTYKETAVNNAAMAKVVLEAAISGIENSIAKAEWRKGQENSALAQAKVSPGPGLENNGTN